MSRLTIALLATLACVAPDTGARAEDTAPPAASPPPSAADAIAELFSKVGNEIYEECVFELSEEQVEVQAALVIAYMQEGADGATARRLAAQQIQPPKLSKKCESLRTSPEANPSSWSLTLEITRPPAAAPPPAPVAKPPAGAALPAPAVKPPAAVEPALAAKPPAAKPPAGAVVVAALPEAKPRDAKPITSAGLAGKTMLPQWDCGPDVDYVTIKLNGYERKLSGGEICKPYEDVVHEVPEELRSFRLGYTIRTGRLFVISDVAAVNGHTIAWAISGRDICRNNPDPDCLAARAVGPLPPGEYGFGSDKKNRLTWGPKTKRHVAAIYLRKLWNRESFTPAQTKAILARGNIAIHARHKGEMSEACLGLEPKGWAYVAALIKDGRASGVNVYIDEPHPKIAEAPPLVQGSGFSLTSLFK